MSLSVGAGEVARFRELVRERTGISLADSRTPDLERAIRQAADQAAVPDADALYRLLASRTGTGGVLDALVSGLNLSETHFFRDGGQIRALEQHILPDLVARRRRERRLRVWSAGCSTGEEAYTLAMLVHRLTADLAGWDVLVLGTDVNGRSLQRAGRGVYRAWSLRGMPAPAQRAHLLRRGDEVEVAPGIRAMVTFRQLNLAEDGYPSPATNTHAMDLILCRNVLLYFDAAGARSVVLRLRDGLRDGGWLLLGQAEAGIGVMDGLERAEFVTAAFRRTRLTAPGDPAPPADAPAVDAPAVHAPAAGVPAADATGAGRPARSPTPVGVAPPAAPGSRRPDPTGEPTACVRALRCWREGQPELALSLLEREADRNPLLPHVHYLHGMVLLDAGRADDALAAFRRSTYLDPRFAPGHLAQAGVLARLGQRRRTGAALTTAAALVADLDPDVEILAEDGLRAADARELIAAQRRLLGIGTPAGVGDG